MSGSPYSLHWLSFHSLVVVLGLVVYTVTSHTRKQRRHPSAGIAWVISLLLLPYVTLPLYLLLGNRKVTSFRQSLASNPRADRPGDIAAALGLPDAVSYEQLAVHQDGTASLNRLRQILKQAQQSVDLCSFLLGSDPVGDEIVLLLMQRARAGVRVRLLLDGLGYYMGGRPDLIRLATAGVQVSLFVSPLGSALRELASAGARVWLSPDMVHAKAVIFDSELALVGSANLDERSLFVNYELMIAFYNPSVVEDFARWIGVHQAGATRYRAQAPGPARELLEGLVRLVAFQL